MKIYHLLLPYSVNALRFPWSKYSYFCWIFQGIILKKHEVKRYCVHISAKVYGYIAFFVVYHPGTPEPHNHYIGKALLTAHSVVRVFYVFLFSLTFLYYFKLTPSHFFKSWKFDVRPSHITKKYMYFISAMWIQLPCFWFWPQVSKETQ